MEKCRKKILIVDDERDLVGLVALHMRLAGFSVLYAVNGAAALETARREQPDLVILDLMLPKVPGLEVCRRLKADPATSRVPVVMLTARAQTQDKESGLKAGADDFITKPFSPRELVERVKKVLDRVASVAT
ncbi:MAG: response regulator transcription factor [Deltaproteobacteria bacterium]